MTSIADENTSSQEPKQYPETVLQDEPNLLLTDEPEKGVFLLTDQVSTDTRIGASGTTWTDQDAESSKTHTELPMIVWLRGDEPWFAEFDLDADQVMQRLNIKRSRLTQISGKELRVGRIRIDRYVRPIYRSEDVEAYLTWTRATASHQRSSSAIKEAVDALQSQGSQIAQVVEAANESFKGTLEAGLADKIRAATESSFSSLIEQVSGMRHETNSTFEALHAIATKSFKDLKDSFDRQTSIAGTQWNTVDIRLDGIEIAAAAVSLRLAEVSEKMERVLSKQSQLETAMLKNSEVLSKMTDSIQLLLEQNQTVFKQRHSKARNRKPVFQAIVQQPAVAAFRGKNSRLRAKKK